MVVCNLYPFNATVADPDVDELTAIEKIDIGGVTLLRAAAKNFEAVTVICDPAAYDAVTSALAAGELDRPARRRLALAAFRHTAAYDAAIASWFTQQVEPEASLPATLNLVAEQVSSLRYGENPHQGAALYRWGGAAPSFEQLQGKAISYNNLVDLHAAWQMPMEYDQPAVAIVKHTNPCGLAVSDDVLSAFEAALACDPVSAFGSIIL